MSTTAQLDTDINGESTLMKVRDLIALMQQGSIISNSRQPECLFIARPMWQRFGGYPEIFCRSDFRTPNQITEMCAMHKQLMEWTVTNPSLTEKDYEKWVAARHEQVLASEMTLRDKFALEAMEGIIKREGGYVHKSSAVAAKAYDLADAMMEARGK